jgi:hypothetical protein
MKKNRKNLKKRRQAYQQNKTNKDSTQLQKKYTQGRKKYANMEVAQKTRKCERERQKYANMEPEQKKARIRQIAANRELKRNTPCKESIAMENPAYVETEEELSTSIRRGLHR